MKKYNTHQTIYWPYRTYQVCRPVPGRSAKEAMKMERKMMFIIIGAVIAVLIIGTGSFFAFTGGEEEKPKVEYERLDQYAEEMLTFSTDAPLDIADEETLYFPIEGIGNGTDVVLLTEVVALVTWSDDEVPPAWRVTYQNEPDIMTLTIFGIPMNVAEGNQTGDNNTAAPSTVAQSHTGTARAMRQMTQNPVLLTGPGENISVDMSGGPDEGDTGAYVSVSCVTGPIRSSGTRLLMYNDLGDEINVNIQIKFRRVPTEVFDYWAAIEAEQEE